MPVSVQHIEEALRRLGGQAHLNQIVAAVSEIAAAPLPEDVGASVRGRLQDHCREASSFNGQERFYSLYGLPARQGWWGLLENRLANVGALDAETAVTSTGGTFDPSATVDTRQQAMRAIKARRGQQKFRDALISAYERRCAISGCAVLDVLEAAHITPYLGPETNHVTNGLLLRADLHTLFDTNLLAVDPDTMTIQVVPTINDPVYRDLHGQPLRKTKTTASAPSAKALKQHRADCGW
ncbi:HNH endonuclease [Roseomonas sp. GCM10028921]